MLPARENQASGTPLAPLSTVKAARVNQVLEWIIAGSTVYDVHEAISTQLPGEDAGELILLAMRELEKASQFDPPVVLGWCFEASRNLYRRMVDLGDFPGALRAVKHIEELARHVQNWQSEGGEKAKPKRVREAKGRVARKGSRAKQRGQGHRADSTGAKPEAPPPLPE